MKPHPEPPENGLADADLEQLASRTPFRGPPTEWRAAILAQSAVPEPAAGHSPPTRGSRPEPRGSFVEVRPFPGWWERLTSGWTWAAAAWALILTLEMLSSGSLGPGTEPRPPFSAAAIATLQEQQREIRAALAGGPLPEPPPSPPADRTRAGRVVQNGLRFWCRHGGRRRSDRTLGFERRFRR